MFVFQKLLVYQKSKDLAVELIKIATGFSYKYKRISDQLVDSSSSVPLNIAEANGRKSRKEKDRFYNIALGSAFETVPILEICLDLKLIDLETYNDYLLRIEEICKMMYGLLRCK